LNFFTWYFYWYPIHLLHFITHFLHFIAAKPMNNIFVVDLTICISFQMNHCFRRSSSKTRFNVSFHCEFVSFKLMFFVELSNSFLMESLLFDDFELSAYCWNIKLLTGKSSLGNWLLVSHLVWDGRRLSLVKFLSSGISPTHFIFKLWRLNYLKLMNGMD